GIRADLVTGVQTCALPICLDKGPGIERNGQRKMWKRLAVFAEFGDFREGVAGIGKQFLRRGRVKSYAELLPGSFIELGTRKVHGRLIAIGGNARPGNVHRGGGENGDYGGDARRGAE